MCRFTNRFSRKEHSTLIEDIAEFTDKNLTFTNEVTAANEVIVCELASVCLESNNSGKAATKPNSDLSFACSIATNLFTWGLGPWGSFLSSTAYGAINNYICNHYDNNKK